MSGLPMMACNDRRPILPVVHWITRSGRGAVAFIWGSLAMIELSAAGLTHYVHPAATHRRRAHVQAQIPETPAATNAQPVTASAIATSRRRRDRIHPCSAVTALAVGLGATR